MWPNCRIIATAPVRSASKRLISELKQFKDVGVLTHAELDVIPHDRAKKVPTQLFEIVLDQQVAEYECLVIIVFDSWLFSSASQGYSLCF